MSGDLVSLRMLVVASVKDVFDIWQQGATQASVPIEFMAADASLAKQTLARGGVDVCIVDSDMPDTDKAAVLAAARAAKPRPFVACSAPAGSAPTEGYDGNLEKPVASDQARQRVEVCIRVKIPSRVLIVDDSGTMRSIVRKILGASHFALEVHEAAEGIAAVNQLRSEKFDLVFLDYNMPGLNGIETLLEIKRESPTVAVVMMTTTLEPELAERARASGALAFLKKPFFPADIDTLLTRHFGLSAPQP
jgi:CheY-like chemotaxis protein